MADIFSAISRTFGVALYFVLYTFVSGKSMDRGGVKKLRAPSSSCPDPECLFVLRLLPVPMGQRTEGYDCPTFMYLSP